MEGMTALETFPSALAVVFRSIPFWSKPDSFTYKRANNFRPVSFTVSA
jgi:hypothetical protein